MRDDRTEERTDAEAAALQHDGIPKTYTFEDLLGLAGTRGPWNILIFCMCGLATFNLSLHMLSYQFLGATPDHWCNIPHLREANWTQHQVLSFAIPFSNSTGKHSSCHMYDYNYTAAAEIGYDEATANRSSLGGGSGDPIKCYSRDFNLTQYQSTVVTEWDLVCERRVLYSTTQSAVMGGNLAGYFLSGYVIDLWGRRRSALLSTLVFAVSALSVTASPSEEVYLITKFLTNVAGAGTYLSLFVFMMETCSRKHRSVVGALILLPWSLGYFAVSGISYLVKTWKTLQMAFSLPTLLGVVYLWLPESPRWLIVRGRYKEALKVLTQVAKVNGKTLPSDDQIMSTIILIGKQEEETERRTGVFFRVLVGLRRLVILLVLPQHRRKTLILFFCWCSCAMVYYGVTLSAHNVNTNPYLYLFLGGVSEVASSLLLWLVLVRMGRRTALAVLLLVCGVTIFIVMTLLLIELDSKEWATVTLSQVGKLTVAAAYQLVWVYTAELYPTQYRSLAVGLGLLFARTGSMCSPYINDLMGAELVWGPSALFGSVSLVSAVLTLLLPETRHLNLTESKDLKTTEEKREVAGKDLLSTSPL